MKKPFSATIPYLCIFAAAFYLLPLLIRDTGSAMFLMLFALPLIVFGCSVVYGLRQRFHLVFPCLVMVLFAPTVFLYYNSTAWPYILVYGALALAGSGIGRLLRRK